MRLFSGVPNCKRVTFRLVANDNTNSVRRDCLIKVSAVADRCGTYPGLAVSKMCSHTKNVLVHSDSPTPCRRASYSPVDDFYFQRRKVLSLLGATCPGAAMRISYFSPSQL